MSLRNLAHGWCGVVAALALAPAAGALDITGLTIVKGGTNTADFTMDGSTNRTQTTSAVSTTLAPSAAPDTVGSFSEFITRYAMLVAADRTNTTVSTTADMISSYSITFTVDNPTGASLKIDIDTLRVGALTNVTDGAGNSVITLGAVTGQLDTVSQAGLGVSAVSLNSAADADTPFSQAGTTVTILTSAVTSTYVLQFDWTSSVQRAQDGAAIRMGLQGGLTTTTAEDYPGVGARTQSGDGHFVDVKATIISTPEPAAGALVAFGVLGLAIRARRAHVRRRSSANRACGGSCSLRSLLIISPYEKAVRITRFRRAD